MSTSMISYEYSKFLINIYHMWFVTWLVNWAQTMGAVFFFAFHPFWWCFPPTYVQAEVEEEQSMEKRFETEVEGDGSVKGPDGDDWYPMNVVDDLEEGGETVPASEGEVKDEL